MPRRLLFDMDYYSSPVWTADGQGNIPVEGLPISEELKEELQAWADEWTQTGMAELRGEREPDEAADAEHDRRGAALLERLRAELGDGWQVGDERYFDGRYEVRWSTDGPWEPRPGWRGSQERSVGRT